MARIGRHRYGQLSILNRFLPRLAGFWGREERRVLGLNLGVHALLQLVAMQFMPLPYYSRLSLHDGNGYYNIAQNLWSTQPLTDYVWRKRFLHVLLARLAIPWNLDLSFLITGILFASLSAVYFYKIARHYAQHPFRLTLLYSALPWLVFAGHHALSEPLLMLAVLAGYYYFLEERYVPCTVAFALALLSKELAAFPALAVGLLMMRRLGWRRTLWFGAALIPTLGYCLLFGLRWGDCTWCLQLGEGSNAESFFSLRTGLYWMVHTLIHGTNSSANPTVALLYDIGNQVLNALLLVFTGLGVWLLWRRQSRELAFFNTVSLVPLWFLGFAQYNLNSSVGRKFLLVSLTLVAYDKWVGSEQRGRRLGYWVLVAAMLALGLFWTLLYAKYFLYNEWL